jgi:virginiamycin A acetyltransferase
MIPAFNSETPNGALASESPGPRGTSASGLLAGCVHRLKQALKGVVDTLGLVVVALPAASARAQGSLCGRNDLFLFWGQVFALVPGLPGNYLRRCYYYLMLPACSLTCEMGFLSRFTRPQAEVGERVHIGSGAVVGMATLADGCLIGSGAHILNGGWQHHFGQDGRLTPCAASLPRVRIGAETWIGEAAVVLADVGCRCIVAAGSVVSNPLPDGCIVGGNPARFVGKLADSAAAGPRLYAGSPS